MTKPDFMKPRVFKGSNNKYIVIVYNNKEETYDLGQINTFAELSKETDNKYTKDDSIRLCKNSGMREVHFSDEIKAHGLICNCKALEKELLMGTKGCKCKVVDDEGILQEINVDYIEIEKR